MKNKNTGLAIAFTIFIVVVLGLWLPSPYLIERPGPTVNTLGEIDIDGEIKPIMTVDGLAFDSAEHPGSELRLLTVSVVGNPENKIGWLALIPAFLDETQSIIPMDSVYQEGITVEDREEYNSVLMVDSQTTAVAAALREKNISYETNVQISSVLKNSPAKDRLEAGDVFLAVDGQQIQSSAWLREYIANQEVGTELVFEVDRDGQNETAKVTTGKAPDGEHSVIGVLLKTDYIFPVEVEVALDGIGGPSAGLIFALSVYDLLSDEDLTGGVSISGTGTVDEQGKVGAIGGLVQKIWGAERAGSELFLFPADNCLDLPKNLPRGLTFVPVESVGDAIGAIQDFGLGNQISPKVACDEVLARTN